MRTLETAVPGSIETSSPSTISLWASRLLLLTALVSQIVVAWRFRAITWDDSAITLGFSRAFALTGRIEPTPGSGVVEGYSTTLWMLLMAAVAKFVSDPATLLAIAKVVTLLLNLVNLLLIRSWFSSWTSESLANIVAGSIGCGLMFYESINGMETPILMTFVLLMLIFRSRDDAASRTLYLLSGCCLLLTRWEAAWFLLPFLLVEPTLSRVWRSMLTWGSVFLLSNLIRWQYFGHILPNTITAKSWPPYSKPGLALALRQHLLEPFLILGTAKIMFVLLLCVLVYERLSAGRWPSTWKQLTQSLQRSWQLRLCVLFTLAALILSTAIGPNWGPPFRSFYTAWPFLLALPLLPIFSNQRRRYLPVVTLILCAFALLRMAHFIQDLRSPNAPVYMAGATVDKIRETTTLLEQVQALTHDSNLTFAGPDMGAVMLFSHDIHVIDLGLLCDPVLAHKGYAVIGSYLFEDRRPEVIETHGIWTKLTGLPSQPLFLSRYRPVYLGQRRLFLTRDLISRIDPAQLDERAFDASGRPSADELSKLDTDPASASRYKDDYALNRAFGSYLVVK